MTTLHEEPLRHNPLQEENEDSYSDHEYETSATLSNDYYAKSRMRSSHTIDSFMDIDKKTSATSTNLLNYRLLTKNQTFHVPTQINKGLDKPKHGKLENVIAGSSPSMNSSTSSGYGSQAVSINNLANDDNLSLQSMSVDENTPGLRNFSSVSRQLLSVAHSICRFSFNIAASAGSINHQHARHHSKALQPLHEGLDG